MTAIAPDSDEFNGMNKIFVGTTITARESVNTKLGLYEDLCENPQFIVLVCI